MSRIDDEALIAFADGELGDLEAQAIESALGTDPDLWARLERQKGLRARVAGHYAPVAGEPVPDRLSALIYASADRANVIDLAAARRRRAWPVWQSLAAMAATLVVGMFAGSTLGPGAGGGPVTTADGMIVARGELARALDRQLASEPGQSGTTRIGVSFAAVDGRFCRTFDAPELSGLACRGDAGWQLVATAAAGSARGGEFRQAGSGAALILQAAQDMMSGDPLDATAERRAREHGWQRDRPRD